MTYTDRGFGTPKSTTIADADRALYRTRRVKSFILTDDSPDLDLPCSVCGLRLDDPNHDDGKPVAKGYHGNRIEYVRRTVDGKRVSLIRPKHYWCSWGALLTGIGTSRDLGEAARKVEALSGGWLRVREETR